jgi:hypothetical protein
MNDIGSRANACLWGYLCVRLRNCAQLCQTHCATQKIKNNFM